MTSLDSFRLVFSTIHDDECIYLCSFFFLLLFLYVSESKWKAATKQEWKRGKGKKKLAFIHRPRRSDPAAVAKTRHHGEREYVPCFFWHSGNCFMDAWLIDKLGNHSSKCRFTMRWGIKKYTHTRGRRNVAQQCCYCPFDVKFLTRPEI